MEIQNHVKLSVDESRLCNLKSNNSFTYILKHFDSETICNKGNMIQITGKRSQGKTFLTKEIMRKMIECHNIDSITVFTNIANDYSEFNHSNIYMEYDSKVFKEIMINQKNDSSKPILLIFDDCFFNNELNKDKNLKEMLLNGRHYKIYSIITFQYPYTLSVALRNNFDYILSFRENNISNIKRLYDYYYGLIPKFDIFNNLIGNLNDYECLLVSNSSSNDIYEKLGYYKANSEN